MTDGDDRRGAGVRGEDIVGVDVGVGRNGGGAKALGRVHLFGEDRSLDVRAGRREAALLAIYGQHP